MKYISYFQSVLTVGVVTHANNIEDAEQKAKNKFENGDMGNCVFEQTKFELSDTGPWEPEIDSQEVEGGINLEFRPDEKTKNIIAERLRKPSNALTSDDIEQFVKESIERALKA